MKYCVFALSLLGLAGAFVVVPSQRAMHLQAVTEEEIDYDAPTERAAAVGNVVTSKQHFFMGMEVPSFISNMFSEDNDKDAPKHFNVDDMALEDECYLGKYGQYEDCVDFDPQH